MAGKDTNIGTARARETRAAAGLPEDGPPPCLLTAVEQYIGIPVVVAALPGDVAGCCVKSGDGAVVLWVNGTHPVARQRFTLAHELGHLCCGHDGNIPAVSYTTIGGKDTDSREVQANAFAAELLAPAPAVRAWMSDRRTATMELLVELAADFGLSTIAALYRLNGLGLLDGGYERLQASVLAGDDVELKAALAPSELDDALAALTVSDLPRLSPALHGSALHAIARGITSTSAAAQLSGVDPDSLADGAELLGL